MLPLRIDFSSGERFYVFNQEIVRFGNAPVPENDVFLRVLDSAGNTSPPTARISRNHFRIHYHDSHFILENISKSTGKWTVDNRKITEKIQLNDGFIFDGDAIAPRAYIEMKKNHTDKEKP